MSIHSSSHFTHKQRRLPTQLLLLLLLLLMMMIMGRTQYPLARRRRGQNARRDFHAIGTQRHGPGRAEMLSR